MKKPNQTEETLVSVEGPNFSAGFTVVRGRVKRCAPILCKHLAGKTLEEALRIIKNKNWKVDII